MRQAIVVLVGLATVLGTAGLAAATHNNVGVTLVAGNPDPMPSVEPDTADELRPIYHSAAPDNSQVSNDPPFFGTYERISPPDQSGLGLGEWVGYINGVVEYPGPGFTQCLAADELIFGIGLGQCGLTSDPLYRANPADNDPDCDGPEDNTDTGENLDDPSDDPCDGSDHSVALNYWPPVRAQLHHLPGSQAVAAQGDDVPANSGAVLPGLYGFYVYLFGDGTGPAAGEDGGTFSYLPADLCDAHLAKLASEGIENNLPDSNGDGVGDCHLITPTDLEEHKDRTHPTKPELSAAPVVCIFAPQFTTLSGAAPGDCQDISEFNMFTADSQSSAYVQNKPGWYIQTGFIDTGTPISSTITKSGDRSDISRIFSFYVNPVNVDKSLFCAAPLIATDADDQLDTGVEQVLDEDGNPTGEWTESGDFEYLVEAHDLDIYTSDLGTIQRGVEDLIPLPPEVEQAIEEAEDFAEKAQDDADAAVEGLLESEPVARASPTVDNDAEPNAPGDNSWSLAEDGEATRCGDLEAGLSEEGDTVLTFYNRLQATISQDLVATTTDSALHDYTYLDEGLPARADEQGHNPWHPSRYTFGGVIQVVEDRDSDGEFDDCPPGEQFPSPTQDRCAARLFFDFSNPRAREEAGEDTPTVPEEMRKDGFRNGTGLYAVLDVTGPVAITSTETVKLQDGDTSDIEERTTVIESEGLNCIVALSVGLDEGVQGDRFAQVIGAVDDEGDFSTTPDAITDALCGDVSGQSVLIRDGFAEGNDAGAFDAAFHWVPLEAHPDADDAPGDGLNVNYLVTVTTEENEQGHKGDNRTAGSLNLGSHTTEGEDTVVKVWDNGDVSYLWRDFDPFTSDPDGV